MENRAQIQREGWTSFYAARMTKYFAFDTETVNRPGGGHACLLLGENWAGGVDYKEFPENFEQIYNFLAPRKFLIAYNAAFDVRAILHPKFLPYKVLEDLANYDCALYKDFRFFHIPGKYLKCWHPGAGGFEMFDIKSFFQGHSLASAARTYLKDDRKVDLPAEIKKAIGLKMAGPKLREYVYSRIDIYLTDPRTRDIILRYGAQDVIVLAKLYSVLAGSFEAAEIKDPPLYSPGAVSMKVFGPAILRQDIGDRRNHFFRQSYYGGRIEVTTLGKIPGPLNYYDLKSAYPAVFADLPALADCEYRQGNADSWSPRQDAQAGAYRVSVQIPTHWALGPFAYRTDQNIIFPLGSFDTWIGLDGLKLCWEYNIPVKVHEYAEFYGGSGERPFQAIIGELFPLRKDPQKSLAVKLILNSGYGKVCESENYNRCIPAELANIFSRYFSATREYGRYTNFAYGAIITERTRLKLWKAAHQIGAVLLATDGIITRGELSAPGTLGEWDYKGKISQAVILGCGRYKIKMTGKPWEYHFRGFSRPEAIFKRLEKCAGNSLTENILDTNSLKQWNKAIDKGDYNVLKNIEKEIFIEDKKRIWDKQFPRIKDYFRGKIQSRGVIL